MRAMKVLAMTLRPVWSYSHRSMPMAKRPFTLPTSLTNDDLTPQKAFDAHQSGQFTTSTFPV
jgi:hypothetical protein